MSFQIIVGRNLSEPNRITKEVEEIATMAGVLKEETSIIDPSFLIEANLSNFALCNYLEVPTFNRKYFVRNITSVRAGLVRLDCHVDVLSSFSEGLLELNALVGKQENNWNLYLNDGTFRVNQNPSVLTRPFPSGFNTMQFILAVAGG